MVNTDGTVYVEYEVRNTYENVITSDTLYLYSTTTGINGPVLSSTTQNEALLPGPIIPDGNGGVLATWTVSPASGPVPLYPCAVLSGLQLDPCLPMTVQHFRSNSTRNPMNFEAHGRVANPQTS